MKDFITGFQYALQGFGLCSKPHIRLFVLVPLLINTLIFALVIIYGAHLLNEFINSFLTDWWEWLAWLLWPVFAILSLTIVFFCFSIVANLIAAPFNGFLAEAVERHVTGIKTAEDSGLIQLPVELKKAVISESRKFLYFFLRAIPLFILFFIPVINFIAPVIWFLFGAWMLALEYMDFPMGNHGMIFPEIRKSMKNRRPLALGFGTGVMLLTLIPFLNFMAIPVAVCGATKMWVEKVRPD